MPRCSRIILCLSLASTLLVSCARTPQQKEAAFLEAGKKHLQAKDFGRAGIDFRNAIQAMPKDAEPHYQLGLTYSAAGNLPAAASEFLNAVKLDPKNLAAELKVAEFMAADRNPDVMKMGRDKAQELLAASPNNADALRTLAVTDLRLEDAGDAVEHLEQALATAPQDLNSSILLARVKLQANDAAGAEEVLVKSVADAPRSPERPLILGRFYQFIHKPADAEKQFRHALELDPKYGPALVALGPLLYADGRRDEAERIFQRASALPDKQYRPLHAIFLLQSGKTEAGIRELYQQYKADVQERGPRSRLVAAYLTLGRNADAEKVLADALKRNSNDADALMQRGYMSLSAGKLQDAQRDLTEAVRMRPDSYQAHFFLARVHRARGASQNQIHELTEVLRLNPNLLAARIELAHAFTLNKSPKSAMEVLDQVAPQYRQSIPFLAERNIALNGLKDYTQLQKGIDQGLANSRDPRLLKQEGLLKMEQKDYRGGRASLEELLKQRPQDWQAVEAVALSYQAENKKTEASSVIRQYTSAAPNSAGGQNMLGGWLLRTGDLAGARAAFQAAKRINANSTDADFGLAEVAVTEGKLDAARDLLTGIVNREPRNVLVLFYLGVVEAKTGHTDAAIDDYNRVLQEDSNNVSALNNLAYLLADTRTDPDKALALAQKVKELAPDNAAIDDTIGWAYYNKGLFKLASDYLAKAGNGATPQRKCHLAMAYIKLGNLQQDATLLQAALKEEPSSPDAKKALQLLAQAR